MFIVGEATQKSQVMLLDDPVVEGLEYFTVTISISNGPTGDSGTVSANENSALVFIADHSGKCVTVSSFYMLYG